MRSPTDTAARLSRRAVQPGHVRTWERSERDVADWCRLLLGDAFDVTTQPRDLADLYQRTPRSVGLIPELKIRSRRTGHYVYVEVKRQGDRGNAEERVYKLFTPTFIRTVAERSGLDYHPFVAVFCDELATHPRYRVRFAAHLEAGTYLCWERRDPRLLAEFLDDLRARWLEPDGPADSCSDRLEGLGEPGSPEGPGQLRLI
jgi:hypothetical protein